MLAMTTKGFVIGLGLIAPLGLQNTWVLNHGIRQHYHFTAAAICAGCDILLINLGIYGNAFLNSGDGTLAYIATLVSVIFLGCYAIYLLFRVGQKVLRGVTAEAAASALNGSKGLWIVIAGTMVVSLLNPHVLVERIVILGAISSDIQTDNRIPFAIGAVIASFVWFFAISSGAARVGDVLSKPRVRLAFDLTVAVMLVGFAIYLGLGLVEPAPIESVAAR